MAAIHDLLAQIQDEALRKRIEQEVDKLSKQKKFGLVFEEHLPECTPLYDMPITIGAKVMLRNTKEDNCLYLAVKIDCDTVTCCQKDNPKEQKTFNLSEIVRIAEFGEPIYPYLKPIDSICNAPESDLWHTLIEADNYHALQLLEYLYAGKVDCIYIDPPYNKTSTKDWKYNCNYVESNDAYRHSKWLSMLERRLRLAKNLINKEDGVILITIDESEYHHLACLLEDIFPDSKGNEDKNYNGRVMTQMVSITINPSGAVRKDLFSRADEYMFIISFGAAHVIQPAGDGNEVEARWWYLRRLEYTSRREVGRPAQFYPIFIDEKTQKIVDIGDPLSIGIDRNTVPKRNGIATVFPIRDDGTEMVWGVTGETLQRLIDEKVVQVSKSDSIYQPYTIKYLSENYKDKIAEGRWAIRGEREDGSKIVVETGGKLTRATTVWKNNAYESKQYGTSILKKIVCDDRFSFPKSLYAVHDAIKFFVAEKPKALIVDFFAGSGTTLHAVNLLNAEDHGERRCILVTNNEIGPAEEEKKLKAGLHPGDEDWEKYGIARYVTWPRTVGSILGKDVHGNALPGTYGVYREDYEAQTVKVVENGKEKNKSVYLKKKTAVYPEMESMNMADGFKTNAIFFKLGFLDKTAIVLGRQLRELIPVLWMKAGALGPCPTIESDTLPEMMILPKNKFAVLLDEKFFSDFSDALQQNREIQTVFLVTDYDVNYRSMVRDLNVTTTYQLYRDYLDNFRINTGRNIR